MSKILEMRQKRAELWDKAKAFLDEHQNENGVMSAEDTEEYVSRPPVSHPRRYLPSSA